MEGLTEIPAPFTILTGAMTKKAVQVAPVGMNEAVRRSPIHDIPPLRRSSISERRFLFGVTLLIISSRKT